MCGVCESVSLACFSRKQSAGGCSRGVVGGRCGGAIVGACGVCCFSVSSRRATLSPGHLSLSEAGASVWGLFS